MAAYNAFDCFTADLAHKKHDLSTGGDQLTLALCSAAPAVTDTGRTDLTEVSYTNCSSRNLNISSSSQTGGDLTVIVDDHTITGTGGAIPTFRYVAVYNDTAAGDEVICWFDYGSNIDLAQDETLTIDFDGTNGLFKITSPP